MIKVVVGNVEYYAKTWEPTAGGIRLYTVGSPPCRRVTIYTEEKIVIYEGIDANKSPLL